MKTQVMQILNQLLNAKDSESKAGGLNILGSLCGLGLEIYPQPSFFHSF